jgi:hypothetical protein
MNVEEIQATLLAGDWLEEPELEIHLTKESSYPTLLISESTPGTILVAYCQKGNTWRVRRTGSTGETKLTGTALSQVAKDNRGRVFRITGPIHNVTRAQDSLQALFRTFGRLAVINQTEYKNRIVPYGNMCTKTWEQLKNHTLKAFDPFNL